MEQVQLYLENYSYIEAEEKREEELDEIRLEELLSRQEENADGVLDGL